jgi:Pyridoxamine 5'-phosphate oxidase
MRSKDVYRLLDTDPIAQELLNAAIPARLAYVGLDESPRAIPIGFGYDGKHLNAFTVPISPKVAAIRAHPQVALTVDTEYFPPHVLMVRGTASVTLEAGVPDEYVEAARRYVPAEMFAAWEQQVRGLYDEMARIAITPTWAKVLDFETRAPPAVARLAKEKGLAA